MGQEINLLKNYPQSKRNIDERGATKTEEDRRIARMFDKRFFDGDRKHGYGGFSYHPRFWENVVPDFLEYYQLKPGMKVLDIGCAKGFMIYDFLRAEPELEFRGVDVSEYAIENAKPEVKSLLQIACATSLPFDDNTFDLVVSINTIHNLEKEQLAMALQEIERVGKGKAFISVDAYRTEEEKQRLDKWVLTAKTTMSVDNWKAFFQENGYKGDYYWFIP